MFDGEWLEDPLNPGKSVFSVRSTSIPTLPKKSGKVKDVYDLGEHLLMVFTDRISAFDVILQDLIPRKGESLCVTSYVLLTSSSKVFPNHLIDLIDLNVLKVRKARRVDLEWVVRAYVYGSLWREYSKGRREFWGFCLPDGLKLAQALPEPLVTPTTKSERGHDVPITKREAIESEILTEEEWKELEEASIKLFEHYSEVFRRRGLLLADAKFEFGRVEGCLVQIDDPPNFDSSRVWIAELYEEGSSQVDVCLDKEFVREALRKAGLSGSPGARLPRGVVMEASRRATYLLMILLGKLSPREVVLLPLEKAMLDE